MTGFEPRIFGVGSNHSNNQKEYYKRSMTVCRLSSLHHLFNTVDLYAK